MGNIVSVPISNVGNLSLAFNNGQLQLTAGVSLVQILESIQAGATNTLEKDILAAAITALKAVSPATPAPVVVAP